MCGIDGIRATRNHGSLPTSVTVVGPWSERVGSECCHLSEGSTQVGTVGSGPQENHPNRRGSIGIDDAGALAI